METQDYRPPERGSTWESVSTALLAQAPVKWVVTNEQGREATLTLAGYRLYFGRSYQVRVSQPVAGVELVGYPNNFVRPQGGTQATVKHGEEFRCVQFKIKYPDLMECLTRHGSYPHELEVKVVLEEGREVRLRLPVVLQLGPTWSLLLLLVLWAAGTSAFELAKNAIWEGNLRLFTTPWPWVWGLLVAALYPGTLLLYSFFALWGRASELQRRYAERWQTGRPAEQPDEEGSAP